MVNSNKPVCVIQDYSIIVDPRLSIYDLTYVAPEAIPYVLTGKVYDHPRFEDGSSVVTSQIINKIDDGEAYETLSTIYRVGKKSPDFELYCNNYNSGV